MSFPNKGLSHKPSIFGKDPYPTPNLRVNRHNVTFRFISPLYSFSVSVAHKVTNLSFQVTTQ
jgi:hypothetical protein